MNFKKQKQPQRTQRSQREANPDPAYRIAPVLPHIKNGFMYCSVYSVLSVAKIIYY